jgi:hypothetical protein
MNPNVDATPGLGLPQPSIEIGQVSPGYTPDALRSPGIAAPRFEVMPGSAAVVAPPIIAMPQPPASVSIQQAAALPADQQTVTTQSDDNDDKALDIEWVNKAREIVERTHTDPYLQSQELSRVKAQYVKARYNKDIKVGEDQS